MDCLNCWELDADRIALAGVIVQAVIGVAAIVGATCVGLSWKKAYIGRTKADVMKDALASGLQVLRGLQLDMAAGPEGYQDSWYKAAWPTFVDRWDLVGIYFPNHGFRSFKKMTHVMGGWDNIRHERHAEDHYPSRSALRKEAEEARELLLSELGKHARGF